MTSHWFRYLKHVPRICWHLHIQGLQVLQCKGCHSTPAGDIKDMSPSNECQGRGRPLLAWLQLSALSSTLGHECIGAFDLRPRASCTRTPWRRGYGLAPIAHHRSTLLQLGCIYTKTNMCSMRTGHDAIDLYWPSSYTPFAISLLRQSILTWRVYTYTPVTGRL